IFHDSVASLPDAPLLIIANEFFDALPARQFVRTELGWCERRVGLTPEGDALAFGLDPEPDPRLTAEAPAGAVLTLPSQGLAVMRDLARRLVARGGASLRSITDTTGPASATRSRRWPATALPTRSGIVAGRHKGTPTDLGRLAERAVAHEPVERSARRCRAPPRPAA
ncbi:protein of unknown function DUF185, partial [Methylorubrum extorquens DSM 13060]